jgi:hypothetical protein
LATLQPNDHVAVGGVKGLDEYVLRLGSRATTFTRFP